MSTKDGAYGKELIIDLHECDVTTFTRTKIAVYMYYLCKRINMERCDLHFWDYADDPAAYKIAPNHLKGISVVQFITTSNITIHALDTLKKIYINIFSCKNFDENVAIEFSKEYFDGVIANTLIVNRL